MRKTIATAKTQPTLYVDLTAEEMAARDAEILANQAKKEAQAPYDELAKLDAELPRWAEDFADQGGFTLYGRSLEVKVLKQEQRSIIQTRTL